jgi:hypothetical protein
MADKMIFAPYIREIDAALEKSLSRHQKAAQQGDMDAMDVELEQQKNLISARNQLQVLQELWPRLVGETKTAKKASRKPHARRRKLKRGQKTPQEAYIVPILHALDELGGHGSVAAVLDRVGHLMSAILNEFDLQKLPSGRQIRWRNTAQWARSHMIKVGLLADNSPRGTWQITDRGSVYLREHQRELSKPPQKG